MNRLILLLCLMALVNGSCKKDTTSTSNSNYLIFGHYYGECIGEKCIEIYKLKGNQLFEDSKDLYPTSSKYYDGTYYLLSQNQYNDVKDLIADFPADLLSEQSTVLGSPDIADGGGLYIEYNFNGVRKFWLIDQMKNNVPVKYHAYMDEVNAKIKLLQ